MRRLELTCDLCGFKETLPIGPTPPTGWASVPVKGQDADACPRCWKKIVDSVKHDLPPRPGVDMFPGS